MLRVHAAVFMSLLGLLASMSIALEHELTAQPSWADGGSMPDSFGHYADSRPVRQGPGLPDLLAFRTAFGVTLLRFSPDKWLPAGRIAFPDERCAFSRFVPKTGAGDFVAWTTGDIDNDGRDEIALSRDTVVTVYSRGTAGLVGRSYRIPYFVRQLTIGDIDNDGRHELVAACQDTQPWVPRKRWPHHLYRIVVCRPSAGELHVLWDDATRLGYGEPEMPDYLGAIADFANSGYRQMTVVKSQSGVQPSLYDFVVWDKKKGGLRRSASFQILEHYVATRTQGDYPLGIMDMPVPVELDGRTYFKVGAKRASPDDANSPWAFTEELHRLQDDSVVESRTVSVQTHDATQEMTVVLDIDGKGTGVLHILQNRAGRCLFRFYRL